MRKKAAVAKIGVYLDYSRVSGWLLRRKSDNRIEFLSFKTEDEAVAHLSDPRSANYELVTAPIFDKAEPKPQHTPGPLEVVKGWSFEGHRFTAVTAPTDDERRRITGTLRKATALCFNPQDATLYAAAPDMKDELELESAWLQSIITRPEQSGHPLPKWAEGQIGNRIICLRAAILRATEAK